MRWTGDGEEGRGHILCFHPILRHFIQIRCCTMTLVVPAKSIEGDQQQFVFCGAA